MGAALSRQRRSRDKTFSNRFTDESARTAYLFGPKRNGSCAFLGWWLCGKNHMGEDRFAAKPNYVVAHRILMACHAMAGRLEEARQAWAIAREIDPTQRISTVMKRWHLR